MAPLGQTDQVETVGADAILSQVTDLSDPCAASGIPSKVMIAEYSNGSMTSGGLGQNRISTNIESTKTMIDRVEAQFDIKPQRLIGDTEYGTAPMLAWMVEENDIEPHVPMRDKTEAKQSNVIWRSTDSNPNPTGSLSEIRKSRSLAHPVQVGATLGAYLKFFCLKIPS